MTETMFSKKDKKGTNSLKMKFRLRERSITLPEIQIPPTVPPGITNMHSRRPLSTAPKKIYRLQIAVDQEEQSVRRHVARRRAGGWLPPVGSVWKTDAKSILQGAPFTNTMQWFYQLEEIHGALPKRKYSGTRLHLIALSAWQPRLQRLRNGVFCFKDLSL